MPFWRCWFTSKDLSAESKMSISAATNSSFFMSKISPAFGMQIIMEVKRNEDRNNPHRGTFVEIF